MNFVLEVSDLLLALVNDGGPGDPVLQRMIDTYHDVAEELGCGHDYERMVAGVLAARSRKGPADPSTTLPAREAQQMAASYCR